MILHKLKLKGSSVAFRDRSVEIDFDALGPGIVCLVGENGSGKTTLMEASGPATLYRHFPSYNESFADHVAPGVRDASSELWFEIGGVQYRALVQADPMFNGGRGKTEAYLFADGAPLAGPLVKAFDAAVSHILPPRELFLASAFASQGGAGSLMSLPKAARKDLFVRMLGVDHLQVDSEAARARGQSVLTALETLRAQIVTAEAAVSRAKALDEAVAEARQRQAAAAAEARSAADAVTAAGVARDAAAAADADARAIAERRSSLDQQLTTAAARVIELGGRIGALADLVAIEPEVIAAVARIAELDAEISELSRRDGELSDALTTHAGALARAQAERDGLVAEFRRLSADLSAARQGAADTGDERAARAAVEDYRGRVVLVSDQLRASEGAVAGAEAEAQAEADAKRRREVLVARRAALAPRRRLLTSLEAPEADICQRCPLTQDARAAAGDVDAIDQELASLPEIAGAPAATALRALQERIRSLRLAQQDAEQNLRAAEEQLRVLLQAQEQAARVEQLEAEVARNREAGLAKRAEIDRLEAERAAAEAERSRVRAAVDARNAERAQLAETAALEPRVAVARAEKQQAERELEAAHAAEEAAAHELTTIPTVDLAALAEQLEGANLEFSRARAAEQESAGALRAAEIEVARLDGERRALGDPAAELEVLRARESALALEAGDWRLLEQSLGRDGVQALLIAAAGPSVTQIVNELLNSCYGPRFSLSIETTAPKRDGGQKEVFDIRIIDAEAGREARQGSGGEMVIIDLALRLGLAIYNAVSCWFELRTLWLDEMTGALSPENADRFVAMLRRAIEIGGFHQVLMISHLPSVWEQADARIHVADGQVTTALQEAA